MVSPTIVGRGARQGAADDDERGVTGVPRCAHSRGRLQSDVRADAHDRVPHCAGDGRAAAEDHDAVRCGAARHRDVLVELHDVADGRLSAPAEAAAAGDVGARIPRITRRRRAPSNIAARERPGEGGGQTCRTSLVGVTAATAPVSAAPPTWSPPFRGRGGQTVVRRRGTRPLVVLRPGSAVGQTAPPRPMLRGRMIVSSRPGPTAMNFTRVLVQSAMYWT